MPNYKVTLDTKDKRTELCLCATYEELMNWIDKTFNMEIKNIKFKKPRIKVNILFDKRMRQLLPKKLKMVCKF